MMERDGKVILHKYPRMNAHIALQTMSHPLVGYLDHPDCCQSQCIEFLHRSNCKDCRSLSHVSQTVEPNLTVHLFASNRPRTSSTNCTEANGKGWVRMERGIGCEDGGVDNQRVYIVTYKPPACIAQLSTWYRRCQR
jgi:hypothetical protein